MSSVETEGKTPQEAIKKALKILGVSREDVKISILCEEERGIFGLNGGKPAKIRVTLKKKVDKKGKNS